MFNTVRVAKVDATVEKKAAGTYGVRGYPTLYYFSNGEKMDFNGQRTKEFLVNWLKKRVTDPVTDLSKEEFEKLQDDDNDKVCVVFQGNIESDEGKLFKSQASKDDYNTYFNVKETEKEGTVVMLRPFGDDVTLDKVDDKFEAWIGANDRPLVLPFDDRTISSVFHKGADAACLFNTADSKDLEKIINEVATKYGEKDGGKLKFTEIDLSGYLKIKPEIHPFFIINAGKQEKFVMVVEKLSELTVESITEFIESWANGEATKFGLTDEVKEVVPEPKEEEVTGEL